jgi:redox-sensitive bicupin YhaK (pirin superfamily)
MRLVVWGDGNYVKVVTGESPVRFLLVSGKPLKEPIARSDSPVQDHCIDGLLFRE